LKFGVAGLFAVHLEDFASDWLHSVEGADDW
jgi:hypothetical protein